MSMDQTQWGFIHEEGRLIIEEKVSQLHISIDKIYLTYFEKVECEDGDVYYESRSIHSLTLALGIHPLDQEFIESKYSLSLGYFTYWSIPDDFGCSLEQWFKEQLTRGKNG